MKEIAYMLHLNYSAVSFHKFHIKETLDIRASAELIQYAKRHLS
jgi:DNA-binding NarL/FixJ family response regulator